MKAPLSLLLGLAGTFLAACTTEVRQTGGHQSSVKIATVQVGESGLSADSKSDFAEYGVAQRLETAMKARLVRTNKLDPKGATLVVTVTDLCVHSTAAVVWVGMMAGRDKIEANVKVVQNGKVIREFVGAAKRFGGLLTGPSARGRVDNECENLADDLTRQL